MIKEKKSLSRLYDKIGQASEFQNLQQVKNWDFSKSHGFGPKMAIFPTFFFKAI